MKLLHCTSCKLLLWMYFLFLAPILCAQTQDQVKIMAYNLLNYPAISNPNADTTLRNPYFRTVIEAANPDILVIEELNSLSGDLGFLTNVMNASATLYAKGTYINSDDTDRGIFFKFSKFQFISNTPIQTALRDINAFKLVHNASGDTLTIFVVHLKASTGVTNEQQRAAEVDSLRKVTNAFAPGSNFMVCGDFNIYGSTEVAYQKLVEVQQGSEGQFYDVLNLPGLWNNPAYAPYHSQSPRLRSFGGGATGGLDDRFDMILFSNGILQTGGVTYVPGSLQVFGNDGQHYNDSINHQPNSAVSVNVANALHHASDHLPVIASLNFTVPSSSPLNDIGVFAFVPPLSTCPDENVTLKVSVKNYGSSSINFANDPAVVSLVAASPSFVITNFSKLLNAGVLAAGADTIIQFQPGYAMLDSGMYTFSSHTFLTTGDINNGNDTMPFSTFIIQTGTSATVSPVGPLQLCTGDTILLSCSSANSYLWSTGATSQAIYISTPGLYTVTVTNNFGCVSALAPIVVTALSGQLSDTIFYENIGSVATTTAIAVHEFNNGFLSDDLAMSGNGDVRNTQQSSNYGQSSAAANVFLTNVAGRNFIISGINTLGKANVELSFGIYKNSTTATGVDLKVQWSEDGVTFNDLSFASLSNGAGWYFRTASGIIPATSNLHLRFMNTGTATQYRIDDILLTGSNNPVISGNGNQFLCPGDTIPLFASPGTTYLWNTGATTQSILATSAGSYSVIIDCISTAPYLLQACPLPVLNLQVLLEGQYMGAGQMRATLYESGANNQPFAADSVHIELRYPQAPFDIAYGANALITTSGSVSLTLPSLLLNQSFFVVLKHRNSLETWSKMPLWIGGAITNFNFPSP
ncbi:MAG: hypothetical protein IPJ86_03665 [Bacteroidetes bacterium]|nr:hypothetical protein [Bacteroidota bacterium]